MFESAPCMWMRGGTSKGAYFLAEDLPRDVDERDAFLLNIMGSPDSRQINGIGGADPLTSKVAIVKKSSKENIDVDYLFLQVVVDEAVVADMQNCGNILAGVGPFSIERGLIPITSDHTIVSIFMENTGQSAVQTISTLNGKVNYSGDAKIDGVPGTASAIPISFKDTAGSSCGALLPTGNQRDEIDNIDVTCIDNGMPVVILRADDMGITGQETREDLELNEALKARLESIRLHAAKIMNLGDVSKKTVPKMTIVSPALNNGCIATRTFIPHRCHASIGVLGAVSVATACMMPDSVAFDLTNIPKGKKKTLAIEHPIGEMTVILEVENENNIADINNAAILRTARKLFDGEVFATI